MMEQAARGEVVALRPNEKVPGGEHQDDELVLFDPIRGELLA